MDDVPAQGRPGPTGDFELSRLETARPSESMAEQVFRMLRSSIVTLRLTPGTALSEQDIATRLDISRQPVREAFIKLSEVGLVRILPQRGTFVVKISRKAVTDARFVREAVECAITRRAAEDLAPEAIDTLRDLIAQQKAAARAASPEDFFMLDEAYHRSLAEGAGCAYAWKVIGEAKAQMDRVRFLRLSEATPMDHLIAHHQDILDAIVAKDADAAEAAMKIHLRGILQSLPRLAQAFPDLFEPG
jgi:GntR family transcriptional regulator, rspAB operon transcriptional repressor